jgi:hypothetical protein
MTVQEYLSKYPDSKELYDAGIYDAFDIEALIREEQEIMNNVYSFEYDLLIPSPLDNSQDYPDPDAWPF